MDTLRGNFAGDGSLEEAESYNPAEDETGQEAPPPGIGQDERRMQVRAYNHWASLLADRNFPSIDDLEPESLPDFAPYSVLLDFTSGVDDPGVSYLGRELARECGAEEEITRLSDVPSRSLLSRITDHYMQILANQAPIGFEAEFVNQRGATILYRGILLPFSSDDDTIDFIYGVINWKEMADQQTTDELMLEIDQALEDEPEILPEHHEFHTPMPDWADGPVADLGADRDMPDGEEGALPAPTFGAAETGEAPPAAGELELGAEMELGAELELDAGMELDGGLDLPDAAEEAPLPEEPAAGSTPAEPGFEPEPAFDPEPTFEPEPDETAAHATEIAIAELDESEMDLGDWLASARELAMAARKSEDRTRSALYDAIGRAYDFSLAAAEQPEQFAEIVADSGLTMQERAPMTPVVKLVFGADYDKTRLTEYASALSHAHRIGLARGTLGDYLRTAEGGLKGVVKAERRLRREEAGKPVEPADEPRERIARKLRKLAPMGFDAIPAEGKEFGLVMIRRLESGEIAVLGEVPDDVALVERAARKLLG